MMFEKLLILYKLIAKHRHLQHYSISFKIPCVLSEDNWIDKPISSVVRIYFVFPYFLLQLQLIQLIVHKSKMEYWFDITPALCAGMKG